MIKKITTILGLLVMLLFPTQIGAAEGINVVIDGQEQNYVQPPIVVNGRTIVPLRGIFESLGASVLWDNDTRTVVANKGKSNIKLTVGESLAEVNGNPVILDVTSRVVNNRTMVPIRFISESLDASVRWDKETKTIYITSNSLSKRNIKDDDYSIEKLTEINDKKIVLIQAFSEDSTPYSQGSGFFIKDNLILTNYHVVKSASSANILLSNGQTYEIEGIVVYDSNIDLAVIKTKKDINIDPVNIGTAKNIKKGQEVFAIGSPNGLQNTVSDGIISGKRTINNINLIQHTVPITFGSSGGALFNSQGEVIGITSSGFGEANLNFAIPIDYIQGWMEKELSKSDLGASFTQKQNGTGTNDLNSKLESIKSSLDNNINSINTTIGEFSLSEWDVSLSNDGTILISTIIDPEQYLQYLKNYKTLRPQLMNWSELLGITLDEMLPRENVYLAIYYQDVYSYYPSSFEANEIIQTSSNNWIVTHQIIEITLFDKIRWDVRY